MYWGIRDLANISLKLTFHQAGRTFCVKIKAIIVQLCQLCKVCISLITYSKLRFMALNIFSLYLFAVISLSSNCGKSPVSAKSDEACVVQTEDVAIGSKLLTLPDAEKIMGEPASLTCNMFTKKGDTLEYKCEYTSRVKDPATDKTGKLYFMDEVYKNAAAAHDAYMVFYKLNSTHAGFEPVKGLGDEAYYHTDGKNFYFYLVRKDNRMFRMKLNKVTSHSSEEEFKKVGRLVTERM